MKKTLLALGLISHSLWAFAGDGAVHWRPVSLPHAQPIIRASQYFTFQTDPQSIRNLLAAAGTTPAQSTGINLPLPDGTTAWFEVWETPISTPEFYARYSNLRTYTGVQKGKPQTTVKLDVNPDGFHAMILDDAGRYFIDPLNRQTTDKYLVYEDKNLSMEGRQQMFCELEARRPAPEDPGGPATLLANGLFKRTFRLALACTGEYAVAATGNPTPTKADVLSKMVTTINRVNGVYEKEVAVSFTLVPNTDTLIFFDGNTDPYTNNNGSAMLNENQSTVTARIGSANYDIGHVFSTGGGGIAAAGALCNNFNKARGVTGSPSPVGDAFDIDFVAHEIGHQCNAQHTFNANTGSCSGNGEISSAYEPGSGSTIMAYAGICGGGDNIQRNSNPYFHAKSLDQITTHVNNVASTGCGVSVPTGNVVPVVPALAASYNIPWQTPFEITAPQPNNAGTAFTYCWEQYDLGSFGSSYSNLLTTGPVMRSFLPDTSRTRVFPSLTRLLRNQLGLVGDRLPRVGRVMNFRLTVRDVQNGIGSFTIASAGQVRVNTIAAVDTFLILNFDNDASVYQAGSIDTLKWAVSNTLDTPISCPTVDIYYSTDSGRTWPYLLAAGVQNDGVQAITIPMYNTQTGRLKVKGSGNIFFAINKALIQVQNGWTQGITTTANNGEVKLYPVPAKDLLYAELPNGLSNTRAQILNTMGQTIWTGVLQGGKNAISLPSVPAGIYYLRLQNAEANFRSNQPFTML